MVTHPSPVLGRHQILDKVWGQVDPVQPGLGDVGTPVEGVLTDSRVEVAEAVK